MDKFQSIRIFVTVAERGGFTAAASKLNLSPSTMTKNVAALEREMGVQLFNRTTRAIALTEIGREFYDRCHDILVALGEAEDATRKMNSAPVGRVRLVTPYSFGRVTLVPELPRFLQTYPDIELDLHFSDSPVDIIHEGFDLAILVRELADSRLFCRTLHRGPEITVASPAYLEMHGIPRTPDDLQLHNCIIGNFGDKWTYLWPGGEARLVQVRGAMKIHSGDAMMAAAVAGLGIAKSTWWLFRKELENGRLVTVLDDYNRPGFPVSVIYPARRLPKRTATVVKFLDEITRPSQVDERCRPV